MKLDILLLFSFYKNKTWNMPRTLGVCNPSADEAEIGALEITGQPA